MFFLTDQMLKIWQCRKILLYYLCCKGKNKPPDYLRRFLAVKSIMRISFLSYGTIPCNAHAFHPWAATWQDVL